MTASLPPRLRAGDTVRVVAPARSRALVTEHDATPVIEERFAALGLTLSYGAHVDERDELDSSSISSRIDDLHAAFADPTVAGVLTVIGGFNSNQLLPQLDFDLVRANPKVLCGYSDITALQNALLARAGLVTYSGPHWSTFGMRHHLEQTIDWFVAALFGSDPIELRAAAQWTDDEWFLDQEHREVLPGEGWWPLRPGSAAGLVVGGNLCTLNLLQGTRYLPSFDGVVLFLEDDMESRPWHFDRDLTSLLQVPDAVGIRGLVVGRFQRASGMTAALLQTIVDRQPRLRDVPVLGNVDFGHTNPMCTFPVGGEVELAVDGAASRLVLTRH